MSSVADLRPFDFVLLAVEFFWGFLDIFKRSIYVGEGSKAASKVKKDGGWRFQTAW